jgi:hypothetical protein
MVLVIALLALAARKSSRSARRLARAVLANAREAAVIAAMRELGLARSPARFVDE